MVRGRRLSNPYTGVFAIFVSRLLSKKAPMVVGTGSSGAIFVSVLDVLRRN
jgi:hypothetical protein